LLGSNGPDFTERHNRTRFHLANGLPIIRVSREKRRHFAALDVILLLVPVVGFTGEFEIRFRNARREDSRFHVSIFMPLTTVTPKCADRYSFAFFVRKSGLVTPPKFPSVRA